MSDMVDKAYRAALAKLREDSPSNFMKEESDGSGVSLDGCFDLRGVVRAVTEVAGFGAWLPIDTAPEKTVVLLFDPDEGVCAGEGYRYEGKWIWSPHPCSYESDCLRPTHWMPRPAPPATASR